MNARNKEVVLDIVLPSFASGDPDSTPKVDTPSNGKPLQQLKKPAGANRAAPSGKKFAPFRPPAPLQQTNSSSSKDDDSDSDASSVDLIPCQRESSKGASTSTLKSHSNNSYLHQHNSNRSMDSSFELSLSDVAFHYSQELSAAGPEEPQKQEEDDGYLALLEEQENEMIALAMENSMKEMSFNSSADFDHLNSDDGSPPPARSWASCGAKTKNQQKNRHRRLSKINEPVGELDDSERSIDFKPPPVQTSSQRKKGGTYSVRDKAMAEMHNSVQHYDSSWFDDNGGQELGQCAEATSRLHESFYY